MCTSSLWQWREAKRLKVADKLDVACDMRTVSRWVAGELFMGMVEAL